MVKSTSNINSNMNGNMNGSSCGDGRRDGSRISDGSTTDPDSETHNTTSNSSNSSNSSDENDENASEDTTEITGETVAVAAAAAAAAAAVHATTARTCDEQRGNGEADVSRTTSVRRHGMIHQLGNQSSDSDSGETGSTCGAQRSIGASTITTAAGNRDRHPSRHSDQSAVGAHAIAGFDDDEITVARCARTNRLRYVRKNALRTSADAEVDGKRLSAKEDGMGMPLESAASDSMMKSMDVQRQRMATMMSTMPASSNQSMAHARTKRTHVAGADASAYSMQELLSPDQDEYAMPPQKEHGDNRANRSVRLHGVDIGNHDIENGEIVRRPHVSNSVRVGAEAIEPSVASVDAIADRFSLGSVTATMISAGDLTNDTSATFQGLSEVGGMYVVQAEVYGETRTVDPDDDREAPPDHATAGACVRNASVEVRQSVDGASTQLRMRENEQGRVEAQVDPHLGEPVVGEPMERALVDRHGNQIYYSDDDDDDDGGVGDEGEDLTNNEDTRKRVHKTHAPNHLDATSGGAPRSRHLTNAFCLAFCLSVVAILCSLFFIDRCKLQPAHSVCQEATDASSISPTASPTAVFALASLTCEEAIALEADNQQVNFAYEAPGGAATRQDPSMDPRDVAQTTIGCGNQEMWTGYHSWLTIPAAEDGEDGIGYAIEIETTDMDAAETWIVAFRGGDCGDLVCIAATDQRCTPSQCSLAIPQAEGGALTVAVGGSKASNYDIETRRIASNDVCDLAQPVQLAMAPESMSAQPAKTNNNTSVAAKVVVQGNYRYARSEDASLFSCGVQDGSAEWYLVNASSSGVITASTCVDYTESPKTNTNTSVSHPDHITDTAPAHVAVLKGSCDNLQCVAKADSVSCGARNQVTWLSDINERYYVVVSAGRDDPVTSTSSTSGSQSGPTPTFVKSKPVDDIHTHNSLRSLSPTPSPTPPPASSEAAEAGDIIRDIDYELSIQESARNDICHGAIPIEEPTSATPHKIYFSHLDATPDNLPFCEQHQGVADVTQRKGTWYKVEGTGSLMKISTCLDENFGIDGIGNNDTNSLRQSFAVQVFRGSCNDLRCLNQTEAVSTKRCEPPQSMGLQATIDEPRGFNEVVWSTIHGETYYIHASSASSASLYTVGASTSVAGAESGTKTAHELAFTIQSTVANDRCATAASVQINSNMTTFGSTLRATIPTEFVSSCDGASDIQTPGVWYTMIGDGSQVDVDTCASGEVKQYEVDESLLRQYPNFPLLPKDSLQANTSVFRLFDTQITVLTGSCGKLECVAGNHQGRTCFTQSRVSWYAEPGRRYYILVHGALFGVGDFLLSAKSDHHKIDGIDQCRKAPSVGVGEAIIRSTQHGSIAAGPQCGGFETSGITYWFKTVGNGRRLTASTCAWETKYNSRVLMLQGDDCDSLRCKFVTYGSCEFEDQYGNKARQGYVEFDSEENVTYYILVHGASGESGQVKLQISEVVDNDSCDKAQSLQANSGYSTRSTLASTNMESVGDCVLAETERVSIGALWYNFTTIEPSKITLRVCTLLAPLTLYINVYGGDCSKDTCVAQELLSSRNPVLCDSVEAHTTSLVWVSEADATYFVAVSSSAALAPKVASFNSEVRISLSSELLMSNDDCDTASHLQLNERVHGTFNAASSDRFPTNCFIDMVDAEDAALAMIGSWYSIRGTGRRMLASSCHSEVTSAASIVSVTTGECANLTCIASNGHFCGLNGQVSWESEAGTLYYVSIGTTELSPDNYTLIVIDDPDPSSDEWMDLVGIDLPPYDQCGHAVSIDLSAEGSVASIEDTSLPTVLATIDDIDLCGAIIPQTIGGVWFHVHGMGELVKLTSSTNSSVARDRRLQDLLAQPAQMVVYQSGRRSSSNSAPNCGTLHCVHSNTQLGQSRSESFVTWFAESDVDYYILAYNRYPSISVRLTLPEYREPGAACQDNLADGRITNRVRPKDAFLSFTRRPADGGTQFVPCNDDQRGNSIAHNGTGAWFAFLGNGQRVRASTKSTATNADMAVSVYYGDHCVDPDCAEVSYHQEHAHVVKDGRLHIVTSHGVADWTSKRNQWYSIFVYPSESEYAEIQHVVELNISVLDIRDTCDGAKQIQVGKLGRIVERDESGPDMMGPTCDDSPAQWNDTPGAWYKVVGDGTTMVLSTCNYARIGRQGIDTQLNLYGGNCEALTCIASNSEYCEDNAQITWQSEIGSVYYVLVRRSKSHVTDGEKVALDRVVRGSRACHDANVTTMEAGDEAIFAFPPSHIGEDRTEKQGGHVQSASTAPSCDFASSTTKTATVAVAATWLKVIGSGGFMIVTTHGYATRMNTTAELYGGAHCGQLVCVDGAVQSWHRGWIGANGRMSLSSLNAGGTMVRHGSVVWPSMLGETYYIRLSETMADAGAGVSGVPASAGRQAAGSGLDDDERPTESLMSVFVKQVASNDICENAVPLFDGDSVSGDTATATMDDVEACGHPLLGDADDRTPFSPGLWYQIPLAELRQSDHGFKVLVCFPDRVATMTVFAGDSCEDLQCLATQSGDVRRCIEYVTPTRLETNIYILVYGFLSTGSVRLNLRRLYWWSV